MTTPLPPRTRQVAGKPLIANQLVASTLAELSTELEMLRALVYRTVGGC